MLGIVLIDKQIGSTSHDVVNGLRRRFQTKRVGHAGTLDPLGTGLLVVAIGPATRFLQYLSLEPKEYLCTFRFGASSTTQDLEGELTEHEPIPADLLSAFEAATPQFLGLIEQIPPMYSAVKKDGRPLYDYARKGIEVERHTRTVHIDSIEILGSHGPDVDVKVVCSGGTYVRTLCHDFGLEIGCGAHLASLRRTRAGRFHLDDAVSTDTVGPENLIRLPEALEPMPIVSLDQFQVDSIRQGRQVAVDGLPPKGLVGLVDPEGGIVGVARSLGAMLQPECVIPIGAPIDSD